MPIEFRYSRTLELAGFSADASPNSSAPPDDRIFRLEKRPPSGDLLTTGNNVFFVFLDALGAPELGPTVDWQMWFRDARSQFWASAAAVDGSACFDGYVTSDFKNADVFVQITAVHAVGSATRLVVRMTEI